MKMPRQRDHRHRDALHIAFIKTLPCLTCVTPEHSDAHHLKPAYPRLGKPPSGTLKAGDQWTVPMCRPCHTHLHDYGDEMTYWQVKDIEPFSIALALFAPGDWERAVEIIGEVGYRRQT